MAIGRVSNFMGLISINACRKTTALINLRIKEHKFVQMPSKHARLKQSLHAVYSRPATWFQGLVLVYYYTGICDVTVTIKIYLVTQNWTSLRRSRVADQEKTACMPSQMKLEMPHQPKYSPTFHYFKGCLIQH